VLVSSIESNTGESILVDSRSEPRVPFLTLFSLLFDLWMITCLVSIGGCLFFFLYKLSHACRNLMGYYQVAGSLRCYCGENNDLSL
jgi:hypothetical protein